MRASLMRSDELVRNGDVGSGRFALRASVELSPRAVLARPDDLRLIPPATRAYLVDLGGVSAKEWSAACRHVTGAGLEPVPHIACRRIRNRGEIDDRLHAMADDAGVRDALVVGGGLSSPAGPFFSTMDLLETGLLDRRGFTRIAVAGHPEGSPDIAPAAIVEALRRKAEYQRHTDAEMRIVTQFGFDPVSAIRWSEKIARDGFTLPIHLGVSGPTSMTTLLKYAARCGVRASASFALKRASALASLAGGYSPEAYVRSIESRVAADRTLIRQLHIYPFGGLAETAAWLMGRGSWELDSRRMIEASPHGRSAP